MEKHSLFLTGESGIGKTQLILDELFDSKKEVTGLFVNRMLKEKNSPSEFALCEAKEIYKEPCNRIGELFIFNKDSKRIMDTQVFDKKGLTILKKLSKNKDAIILLDEVGGIELLEDTFFKELLLVFDRINKIIGVYKSNQNYKRQQNNVATYFDINTRRKQLLEVILDNGSLIELNEGNRVETQKEIKKFITL